MIAFVLSTAVACAWAAPATQNIIELAESTKDLSTLVGALVGGGLVDTLSSSGPFTVFAPTNEAFDALPAGTLESLMKPENKAQLVDILTYHVIPGRLLSTDLKAFQVVKTVEGKPLHLQKWGGQVHVGRSLESKDLRNVTLADNLATNGVVHIIDGVLLPPSSPSPSPAPLAKPITLTSYLGRRGCSPPVKGVVELEDGKCYALSAVKTSAVNTDQRITCLANGDAIIISYRSQDGTCTRAGGNLTLFANSCMLGESVGGKQFSLKHKCPGTTIVV